MSAAQSIETKPKSGCLSSFRWLLPISLPGIFLFLSACTDSDSSSGSTVSETAEPPVVIESAESPVVFQTAEPPAEIFEESSANNPDADAVVSQTESLVPESSTPVSSEAMVISPDPVVVEPASLMNAGVLPDLEATGFAGLPSRSQLSQSDQGLIGAFIPELVPVQEPGTDTFIVKLPILNPESIPPATRIHEYSRRQAFNVDESLILIGNVLIDSNTLRPLDDFVPLTSSWNWSNKFVNIVYGIPFRDGVTNEFGFFNISTGIYTTLRTFQNMVRCSIGAGEGRISDDDRYIVISCRDATERVRLYSLDIYANEIIGTLDIDSGYDWAGASPSGEFILVKQNLGESRLLTRYSNRFADPLLLEDSVEHGDIGIDVYGDELFFMINANGLSAVRLRDGEKISTKAEDFSTRLGFGHISCLNIKRPGWCYFSAHDANWLASIELRFNGASGEQIFDGRYEFWGLHRSTHSFYEAEPKISVSPSGTQAIYTSDFYGQTAPIDYLVTPAAGGAAWLGCLRSPDTAACD